MSSQLHLQENQTGSIHAGNAPGMTIAFAHLQATIKRLHGCDSLHEASVPVTDTFRARTVWVGTVEVFSLIGHPNAKRCFAWSHFPERDWDSDVAVLEIPPIDSPLAAVRAVIVAASKVGRN